MSTTQDFIDYVINQIDVNYLIRYKKMFGEYMVYVDQKPALLVCDNVVYVKMIDALKETLNAAEQGFPYDGAKLHYILDIDDKSLTTQVIEILLPFLKVPVKKKKKEKL